MRVFVLCLYERWVEGRRLLLTRIRSQSAGAGREEGSEERTFVSSVFTPHEMR